MRILPKRIRLLFAWYDMWIGAFWDAKNGRLYLLPFPCVGVILEYGNEWERKGFKKHGLKTRFIQS